MRYVIPTKTEQLLSFLYLHALSDCSVSPLDFGKVTVAINSNSNRHFTL